jgi:Zinc-binding dehydrogenase
VQGGGGAVGLFVVQLAHRHGAYVIATASSKDISFVQALGADRVIDYKASNFEDGLMPVDVVFDTVGGSIRERSAAALNSTMRTSADGVNKEQQPGYGNAVVMRASAGALNTNEPVTEKAFEDYHLPQPTTRHDRETRQVTVPSSRSPTGIRICGQNQQYGTQSNPHVWMMREFANSDANHSGVPLPKGRVRFYRRDQDDQVEFTGENQIDHTLNDEMVRVYTGNAFDITGERRQTRFQSQFGYNGWLDESFGIRLRNHKQGSCDLSGCRTSVPLDELVYFSGIRDAPSDRQQNHRIRRHAGAS